MDLHRRVLPHPLGGSDTAAHGQRRQRRQPHGLAGRGLGQPFGEVVRGLGRKGQLDLRHRHIAREEVLELHGNLVPDMHVLDQVLGGDAVANRFREGDDGRPRPVLQVLAG